MLPPTGVAWIVDVRNARARTTTVGHVFYDLSRSLVGHSWSRSPVTICSPDLYQAAYSLGRLGIYSSSGRFGGIRGDSADAQSRLAHELDQGVVPRGYDVGGGAGGTQQHVDFVLGQTHGLLVVRGANGSDSPRGVSGKGAGAARPTAQPA